MAATFQIIQSGQGIIAQADELTRVEQRAALRGALRDIMKPTLATAIELCPKDTGNLAASLKLRSIARTRRGIGVLIVSSSQTLMPKDEDNPGGASSFSHSDRYYGSFVHMGHRFGKRGSNISIGIERGRRSKKKKLFAKQLKLERYNQSRAKFPGIPFLYEAGLQHRERMDRELKEQFAKRVQEAMAKR